MKNLKQKGVALFVGMIFLLVLTVLGLTAAKVSTLDERMAGNYLRREQAAQHSEEAQNDTTRYIALCNLDSCPTVPTTMIRDPEGNVVWNTLGETNNGVNVLEDEKKLLQIFNDQGSDAIDDTSSVVGTGSVTDYRSGSIATTLDLQGGLMGLEPGSTQRADYYRITSLTRKGDLSNSPDARSTDVIRQIIFVP